MSTKKREPEKAWMARALKAERDRDEAIAALRAMVRVWERLGPGSLVSISGKPTSLEVAKAVLARADAEKSEAA